MWYKLNAECGINSFYMGLIPHHTVICKGLEVPGFCNMGGTTAEEAASLVTM